MTNKTQKCLVIINPGFADDKYKEVAYTFGRIWAAGLNPIEYGYIQLDNQHVEKLIPNIKQMKNGNAILEYMTSNKAYGIIAEGINAKNILNRISGNISEEGSIRENLFNRKTQIENKSTLLHNPIYVTSESKNARIDLCVFRSLRKKETEINP